MPLRMLWCALFSAIALPAAGQFPDMGPPTVGIIVTWDQSPPPAFLKLWRREVEEVFRPTGVSLRWEMGPRDHTGTYDRVVIVRLQGRCSGQRVGDSRPSASAGQTNLGWTYVVDGDVIPHSVVDCDAVAQAVAEMRARLVHPLYLQAYFYRLAGRVLVHEMLHALLETTAHDLADFTRSPLQVTDLMTAPKLRPAQIAALRQIGRAKAGWSVARGTATAP